MRNLIFITSVLIMGLVILESCKSNNTSDISNAIVEIVEPEVEHNYLEIGRDLAIQTKSNLSLNLVTAISKDGSAGAVEFCNLRAIPITDSMSLVLDAHIKRVSDQPRNPDNTANESELAYINQWKEAKERGEEQPPVVNEINGKMVGYYPIVTNQLCMQCHGIPKTDINVETLNKINKLYPSDQAIRYHENQIRGLFVVEMVKR